MSESVKFSPPPDALCSVLAKYIGEERIELNGTNRPGDRLQAATDVAIKSLLSKELSFTESQHVFVCVKWNVLELQGEHEILSSCPISKIAFCGRGTTDQHCFAFVRRENEDLLCVAFKCSTKQQSIGAVQSLAAAFGATLKSASGRDSPARVGRTPLRDEESSPALSAAPSTPLADPSLADFSEIGMSPLVEGTPQGSTEADNPHQPSIEAEMNANTAKRPGPILSMRLSIEDHDEPSTPQSRLQRPKPSFGPDAHRWLAPIADQDGVGRDLSPARLGAPTSRRSTSSSRKKQVITTKSATGCLICAQYLGKVPEGSLPQVQYRDNQAKADAAVHILWQRMQDLTLESAEVVVVVRTEVLEIVSDSLGMTCIPRQNIKSASQGQAHASFFVIGAKHPETKAFCYHIFAADDPMLAWASVEALARAFGAKDADKGLLAPSPGMPRKNKPGQNDTLAVTSVNYMGFMDTVGSNYSEAITQCIKCQLRRVLPAQAQLQLKANVLEFHDPERNSLAKWFQIEDIDCLLQYDKGLGVLISRGNWREVRHCCYVITTPSESTTTDLKHKIIKAINANRDEVVAKALPGVLSYIKTMFEGNSLDRNLMQLQQELDMLPEPHRTSVIWRLKAQKLHCKTDEDKMTAILSLFARLYGTTKLTPSRKSAPPKPRRTITGNLAASWESLLGRGRQGGKNARTQGTVPAETSAEPRTPVRAPAPVPEEVEEASTKERNQNWRQELFRSVTTKPPRKETPGRRQSSAALLDTPKTAIRRSSHGIPLRVRRQSSQVLLALGPRSDFVRARWQKAVQQQLLLIRMGKANAQLESQQKSSPEVENAIDQKWSNLLEAAPQTWTKSQIRECLDIGLPEKRRREFWLGMGKWLESQCEDGLIEPYNYVELLVEPCIYWHAIKIDVDRAFPDRPLFKADGGGQKRLFNTMKAYSNFDVETGYCQGLHFVAGTFLMQLTEQDAFGVLVPFLYHHGIREQYMHDMSALKVHLYQFSRLVADTLPAVFSHFQTQGVEPFFYAAPWFLSLFSSTFPEEFAAVVFDNALLDGIIVVFRVGVALLSLHQHAILQNCSDLEETLTFFEKEFPQTGINAVMAKVQALDITATKLEQYAAEFTVMDDNAIVDIDESVDLTERVSMLTERLMDSERIRLELDRELDICKQQLNHAKAALQGLTLQNDSNEEELVALRKAMKAFSEA